MDRESHESDQLGTPVRGLHARDQLLHAVVDGAERVLAQHGALRLVVELEVNPVDGEVAPLLLGPLDEVAAQPGPRGLWRHRLGLEDLEVAGDAVDRALALEQVVQPAAAVDVVVREVDLRDPRGRERQVVLGAVALDQLVLRHPVYLALDLVEVARVDRLQRALPQVEHALGGRVCTASLHEVACFREVLELDLQRARLAAVGELHAAATGHVVADLADRADGVLQRQVAHDDAGFDHAEDEVRRTDLQQGRGLGHVRVTDDDVQAAEPLGVGVRLVAGVDDRSAAGGRAADALPDVLGALADAVDRAPRGLQHLAGTADDLACHEEWDQHVGEPGELAVTADEVVLVAAVGVAGRVSVVLEEVDVARDPFLAEASLRVHEQALEGALPGLVMGDEVDEVVALGRGVLRVAADVEVEPGAVLQEDVAAAAPRHDPAEEVARHLVRAEPALTTERARDAVLVLEAIDPAVHAVSLGGRASCEELFELRVRKPAELPSRPRAVEHGYLELTRSERA